MSMNNFARRPAARDRRAPRAPSIASAMDLAAEDKILRRQVWRPFDRFVAVKGLSALVAAGEVVWGQGEDNPLPWNLDKLTSTGFCHELGSRWGQWLPQAEAGALLERYARFGGWLRAARTLPVLRRLVRKTQSRRGTGSPRTRVALWALAERFPSPGALERRLRVAKAKAEAVLATYPGGLKPSWADLANALMLEARPNKAALIAVAGALGYSVYYGDGYSRPQAEYRKARDWLVEHRSAAFPVADATDGVACRLATEPELTKLGVTVTPALVVGTTGWETGRREIIRIVRKGERSFHSRAGSPEAAMAEAIKAWRAQDAANATEGDLVAFLRGTETGVCPLVYRQDSYAAGNCSPGTEAWLRQVGFARREFIPGVWLVNHLHDDRVKRVVKGMMREFAST